jgi:hypothetical protein
MKLRPAPTVATWILKLFCSSPEHESVIGDLMEQYQRGHSSLWYWRQVFSIAVLGLYHKAGRRTLVSTSRIPIGAGFALILLIAALSAVMLSDIWPILLPAILAGLLIGGLKFFHNRGRAEPTTPNAPDVVRIDSSKIAIGGGLGAGIVIVILLSGVLHDLPQLRQLAAPGILAGLLFALVLRLWRRGHVPTQRLVTLGLKSDDRETPTRHR